MICSNSTKKEQRLLALVTYLFICLHTGVFSTWQEKSNSGHKDLHEKKQNLSTTFNIFHYKGREQTSFEQGMKKGKVS